MDSHVIKNAISGDPEALALLVNEYKDLAYNLAFSIIRNKEDAMDITQDSFLKVLEHITEFRNDSKFSTWLYRIVYNQSIQFIRKTKLVNISDINSVRALEYPDNIETQEDKYLELYQAIDRLEENERNIILLFYLAEKSVKEIRVITGLSISNIKVILHRARKRLHEKIIFDYEKL